MSERSESEQGVLATQLDPDWPELPPADASVPHAIGRFVVLRRIGRGSMGDVFSAYDEELARRVAIKLVVQPEAHGSRRARMRREAQAMAKVSHPNVIHVFDDGLHRGDRLARARGGDQRSPSPRCAQAS